MGHIKPSLINLGAALWRNLGMTVRMYDTLKRHHTYKSLLRQPDLSLFPFNHCLAALSKLGPHLNISFLQITTHHGGHCHFECHERISDNSSEIGEEATDQMHRTVTV
jgi:hypothetical protein